MRVGIVGMDTEKLGKPEKEIIFSLIEGHVYVSWPGTVGSLKLGTHQAVSAMMEDFLEQNALSQRLNGQKIYPRSDPNA